MSDFNLAGKDVLAAGRQPYAVVRGIYFLWEGDEIVYIGQSVNIHARVAAHFASPWAGWKPTAYSLVESADLDMHPLEQAYILEFKPKHNRAGITSAFNSRRGRR